MTDIVKTKSNPFIIFVFVFHVVELIHLEKSDLVVTIILTKFVAVDTIVLQKEEVSFLFSCRNGLDIASVAVTSSCFY